MIGTFVIAGTVGFAFERMAFTRNGHLRGMIIYIGGAFLFYFVALTVGFRAQGLNAIAASIGVLVIVPTHWRR